MSTNKKKYYAPMHTAEHILNQAMFRMFKCERSVNCHIERKTSKCDFKLSTEPTAEQIKTLENKIIEVINKNYDITEEFLDFDEANKLFNLQRINKDDNPKIRVIKIGDYDSCPCIGEHVSNTQEIKSFRITTNNFNNGIFRIRFKAK